MAEEVLFLVGTVCNDPAQEEAFNQWYNRTHIPEVTSVPGVKSGIRFQILDPEEGYPKYIALYQMDGEQGYRNFIEHGRKQRRGEAPPFTPGPPFQVVWRKAYRKISP